MTDAPSMVLDHLGYQWHYQYTSRNAVILIDAENGISILLLMTARCWQATNRSKSSTWDPDIGGAQCYSHTQFLTLSQINRKIQHVENNALNPFVLEHIDRNNASIQTQSDILMSPLRFKSSGMHTVSHGKQFHSGQAQCQETGFFTNTAKRILNLIMSSCVSAHTFTHIILNSTC